MSLNSLVPTRDWMTVQAIGRRPVGQGVFVVAGRDAAPMLESVEASSDGVLQPVECWADLQRDCARRGMCAPVLAIADCALGFWSALREVFPTREQRCWFHKIANVLAALLKSTHPSAKKALAEVCNAEDKLHAIDALKMFEAAYGAKFPKAVAKIIIELTFATVRHRTKITKGPGSHSARIAMAYKLIEAAQPRWRAVNAPNLVALV